MLALLASFFFSGFFLSLDRLDPGARWVAKLLPATHGIAMARDVMLRGRSLSLDAVLQATALAAVAFLAAWRTLATRFRVR